MPFLSEQRVEPGGPDGTVDYVVCGEGPAVEELKAGLNFVGASGSIIWPLIAQYAQKIRDVVWTTNLSKRPLSNEDGAVKLTAVEFEECRQELFTELEQKHPRRILAVGSLAAKALLGSQFTTMDACSGGSWSIRQWEASGFPDVIPTYHPAVALRPGGGGKLAHLAQAIKVWGDPQPQFEWNPPQGLLAIDTEGLPDDPICLTWAVRHSSDGSISSGTVLPGDVPEWWRKHVPFHTVVWHNALWDWAIVEAMGVARPWDVKWMDTMQLAYERQEPSKSLKNLSWKYLGVKMRSFMDVVGPHYEEVVRAAVAGRIEAGTSMLSLQSEKTGKYLKAKPHYEPEAKMLRRLRSVDSMVERIGFGPPTLRYVPDEEREAYAEQDAVSTLRIAERFL